MPKVLLIILDGWGYSRQSSGNPIFEANTPTMDFISSRYPMKLLQASGPAAGLPWGEPGNSEVGHLTIGAGRVIQQPLVTINKAISDNTFFQNQTLVNLAAKLKQSGGRLHLCGLMTSGSVHAHKDHLLALLDFAKRSELNVFLHLFTDGKDSKLKEGRSLLFSLEEYIKESTIPAKVVSLIGRNFGMDRNSNWSLTQKAYALITKGEGNLVDSLSGALQINYEAGITDESMPPYILNSAFGDKEFIQDGDGVLFFNFREDSMRQLVSGFVDPNFKQFPVEAFKNLKVVSMVPYSDQLVIPTLFGRLDVSSTLAEIISKHNLKQLHVAETEKYAHVTYFFNGLRESILPGEDDILIQSVKDIVNNPQMRSRDIATIIVDNVAKGLYDFTLVNFANPDMAAHTGNFQAAVKAVEAVDLALNWVLKSVIEKEDTLTILTADHGNIENLVYKGSGEVETKHDLNPVPCFLVNKKLQGQVDLNMSEFDIQGLLADIAPTVLEFLNLPIPKEMTGQSLLS